MARNQREITFDININGCWNCISHCKDKDGYPQIRRMNRKQSIIRYLYEKEFGIIPSGCVLRHKCDNPQCINLEHIEIGTQKDNMRDSMERGRRCRGIRHKKHKLIPEQVIEIRKSKKTTKELSKDYGISFSQITAIKRGSEWKWLN